MDIERKVMDTWGSVITAHRARELGSIIEDIAAASRNPLNRQVGNVIGDLKNLNEFDLIEELKRNIEAYNEVVREENKATARRRDIRRVMREWANTKAKRDWIADWAWRAEAIEQEIDLLDLPPVVSQWVRQWLGREFAGK